MISVIVIRADGAAVFVHDDSLAAAMRPVGPQKVRRASHVEPDGNGGWTADMSPVGGPVLGPFATRKAALLAEHEWLEPRLATIPV